MSLFICQFCGSERKNANAKSNHEVYCKENPNRKIPKGSPGKRSKNLEEVNTSEKCSYGCNQLAKYRSKSGKLMCDASPNKCPEIKKKNSKGGKTAYASGKRLNPKEQYKNLPDETKEKMSWAKGLTKETDERVRKSGESLSRNVSMGLTKPSFLGKTHSKKSKKKMSLKRLEIIKEGKYDSSGRKGHRGHYDGIYFHSSWELAFYIYNKEVYNVNLYRNKELIEYFCKGEKYVYIPDFVDEEGNLFEVKGYLYSDRDKEKYNQTKHFIDYIFGEDLQEALAYTKEKYGKKFWSVLYNQY